MTDDRADENEALDDELKEPAFDLRDRTFDFALRIIRLYKALPDSGEAHVLGKQLLRSGTSVGANYREAHRGRSKPEFSSKIGDCLKALDETSYWLDLLSHAQIVPAAKLTNLQDENHQLLAIFTTIAKKTKANL